VIKNQRRGGGDFCGNRKRKGGKVGSDMILPQGVSNGTTLPCLSTPGVGLRANRGGGGGIGGGEKGRGGAWTYGVYPPEQNEFLG